MEGQFDLIVIGAGPGGYVAAIKAAKLGLKTAVIENREVGGTCLNRGCIPAKAMIHASSIYREMQNSEEIGIFASEVTYDYGRILEYKERTTRQLVQGIEQVLKANSVEIICGTGTLLPGNEVKVASEEGEELLKAKDVLLASGSRPLRIPIPGIDLPGVITSDDLFRMKEVPESLVMIGGGVISVEFATVYAALGTKVTILEAMPRLVPNMDKEISQNLKMILKKRGIEIHTAAAVQSIEQDEDGYLCHYTEKEKEQQAKGAYVLCAVGRCANTDGLLGEDMTLELAGGRVVVDEHFATSMPHVYAIGGAQLAHAASAQGVAVAERLAGKARSIDVNVIPGCVYTDPEIASAGLTEDEAKEKGIEVETGKFIMSANGRSIITKEERGFIKVVADKESHVILGAQMMCARATDMIGEFVTAITNQMTVSQLLKGMRAHPTYNEGIGEALEELEGGAIHVLPKKKR